MVIMVTNVELRVATKTAVPSVGYAFAQTHTSTLYSYFEKVAKDTRSQLLVQHSCSRGLFLA